MIAPESTSLYSRMLMAAGMLTLMNVSPVAAQETREPSAIRQLADGYRVSRRLFVRAIPTASDSLKFEYFEDREATDGVSATLVNGTTFVTDRHRGLVLLLGFVNPLRHTWSTAIETSDDPTYASASKFLQAITAFAEAGAGIGAATTTASDATGRVYAALREQRPAAGGDGRLLAVRSPTLISYSVWLQMQEVGACAAAGGRAAFDRYTTALINADEALFATPAGQGEGASRAANTFASLVRETGDLLYRPTTMEEMKAAAFSARTNAGILAASNKKARATLDAVSGPTEAFAQSLGAGAPFCQSFAQYSQAVVAAFAQEAAALLQGREKLVSSLQDVNAKLEAILKRTDGEYFRVSEVSVRDGQIADVTLTIKRRERAVNATDPFAYEDRKASAASFRVRPEQTISLEFGLGVVALGSVMYPKFGTTGTGTSTTVSDAGADRQYASPVALLNLVGILRRAPLSPILQLGVGSGKNYPLLLAGVGVRFTRFAEEFSLTGGVAFPFVRKLKTLSPGDPVSGTAELERDLTVGVGRRGFYLGIQRSL